MARNKLSDLNNHLFAQLERLEDENLKPEELKAEVQRAAAISKIASQVIGNAKVTMDAMKLVADGKLMREELPENFGVKKLK